MDAAEVIVTQSGASATFDAGLGNTFEITLTGNVTSSTLVNVQPGQWLAFIICQGGSGGPWTFAWPSNVFGGGAIGSVGGNCSTQTFYASGANAWATGPMMTNLSTGIPGLSLPAASGTVSYFTGTWTNGNCLQAGGSPGLISVTAAACGTGGGSVNVNGSAVASPNFNGTTPAAGGGFTNITFQVSGSNVSAEFPNTLAGDLAGSFSAAQVTGLHFGATGLSLGTVPTSGQCLEYNGINVTGAACSGGGSAFSGGSGSSFQDVGTIAVPANPAANFDRLFQNTDTFSCITSTGAYCGLKFGTLTLTNQNSFTLGSGTQASPSFYYAQSGNGASNTTPAYLRLAASPANTYTSFLFPCQAAGNFCLSSTTPAADSNKTLAVHGGVNAQTGTTYTVVQSDEDGLTTFSNAAAIAVTLTCPTATTFLNGWLARYKNLGAGAVTFTIGAGCQLNGTAGGTAQLSTNQTAELVSDGVNEQLLFLALPSEVYNTNFTSQTAAMAATTMTTAPPADTNYTFEIVVGQLNGGTGCTGDATVSVNLIFTDSLAGTVNTMNSIPLIILGNSITTLSSNVILSHLGGGVEKAEAMIHFRAKASTAVQFSTAYTAGAGCTTSEAYNLYPVLVVQ